MVSIFLRSLVYNVVFYLVLVFWIIVAIPTFVMPRWGILFIARCWARERGFKSLIVVTSNYHMPRAILELSHAMPDIALIPFAVVGERWRDEPWWTSGATLRLLLSEYAKYVAAEVRVRLADLGLDLTPEFSDQPTGSLPPRRPATAEAN